MYTTTTTPEAQAPMQATTVTPRAASSFFKEYFQDLTFIQKFSQAYNAQPKKSADAFTVFQALTGCKIAAEDSREFIETLVDWTNYNNIKLKHALYIPDGGLNLTTGPTPNTKPKQVKPARTFAVLAKLVSDDALNPSKQCIHLDESEAMATDAFKLLAVECTYGTRQEIEADANATFERASLSSIARGLMMEQVKAIQQANADRLSNNRETVMINATTGEVTEDRPLQWRNIMPSTPATHERTETAADLFRLCTLAMDKARNIDKTVVRTFRFKSLDEFTVNVNAQLLLEIATALMELECAWINLSFEQRETGYNAVRLTAITGEAMKVQGLLMPIASKDEPQLLVEQLTIFRR